MKNNFNNNRFLLWFTFLISSLTMISCYDWDDYKKYTKDGEITYVGKFDTIIVKPGKERVRLSGILMPDPKIVKCKIYWNSKKDSVEFPIDKANDGNNFEATFTVEEGVKSFSVFTYDVLGNSSVAVNVIGTSYGERYRNRIRQENRKMKFIDYDKGIIYWENVADNSIGPVQTEVRYKAITGDTVIITPTTGSTTILKGFKFETDKLFYRTVFKPEPASIDTFCTAYRTPALVETEIDRTFFKAVSLPGDVGANGGSGGIASMWDGKANGYGNSSFTNLAANQTQPSIITFEIGMLSNLTKVWILPFKDPNWYSFTTMKRFEIWGSANPDPSGALDASWNLLASKTVVRPSGLPESSADTPADIAAASVGFTWPLDTNAPRVRYLRIRCLESFRSGFTAQSIGEIKVYGKLPK